MIELIKEYFRIIDKILTNPTKWIEEQKEKEKMKRELLENEYKKMKEEELKKQD